MPTEDWVLQQLSEQQAAITMAEKAMLEGRYSGPDSLEAWLLALDPSLEHRLNPRVPLFDIPPPPSVETPEPPIVEWKGSPNYWTGHGGYAVCAIVLHTMAGSLAGCTAWFAQQEAQVCSHYGIGLDGQNHQYVSLSNSSWANGVLESRKSAGRAPRAARTGRRSRSRPTTMVTPRAYPSPRRCIDATLAVATLALQTFPSITWLLGHKRHLAYLALALPRSALVPTATSTTWPTSSASRHSRGENHD